MSLPVILALGLSSGMLVYSLLAYWFGHDSVSERLERFSPGAPGENDPSRTRRWSARIGNAVSRRLPVEWTTLLRGRLQAAGEGSSLESFLGTWVILVAIWYLLVSLLSLAVSLPAWLTFGALAAALLVPVLQLHSQATERVRKIRKAFPFFIDFVTMAVEAGLSLDAGLMRASQKVRGPLGEEGQRYLQNVSRGLTRQEALLAFAAGVGLPEVQDFVQVLLQSGNLGLPLSRVLRGQAQVLRENRRLLAEEAAQKLPIKLLFPLALFIFPTILLIVMGPAVIWFLENWS